MLFRFTNLENTEMDMYSLGIKNISAQSNGDPPFTKQDMK